MKSSEYNTTNLFPSFIKNLLVSDFDFENFEKLYMAFSYFLIISDLIDEEDLNYLDFSVIFGEDKNDIELVGNNIVTALWLCNVFPENVKECYINSYYENKTHKYDYLKEEKKLLITKK